MARAIRHIGQYIKSRGIILLLVVLFAISPIIASAQINPYARGRRGERTIIRSGMIYKPDSAEVARADSMRLAKLVDTLRKISPDSLVNVPDSVRKLLPDTLRTNIFGKIQRDSLKVDSLSRDSLARDSLARDTLLSEKQRKRLERRENRKPFLSDSMSLRKVCIASALLPGFGQIYNKQYWKLPILYGTVGTSLGMCIWSHNKYKPLKQKFNEMTDVSLSRTPELNALQREMIKYNTMKQAFMFTTIASYLYFIGDAAVKYSTNDVSHINRATTLSMICPGAGQIYNKSYWRVPIVVGGFAATLYCIDWNNRGYQRFKKAYRLRADYDAHPELYPDGSNDEFGGRYSATFLKNMRNSYRRNRDLCIILTAGLYILNVVDAHVDAHMRDYDISKNLTANKRTKVNLSPDIQYAYNRMSGQGAATIGMNLGITF